MEKYRLVQEHKADGDESCFLVEAATSTTKAPPPSIPPLGVGQRAASTAGTASTASTTTTVHGVDTTRTTKATAATATTATTPTFPEVRITQQGKPRNYISYAMNLFSDGSPTIVLKAMGRAINKAVTIAEILKRKMPLHQWNFLSSQEMIDVYEPMEEGLDVVTSRRYVSCMKITLSKTLLLPSNTEGVSGTEGGGCLLLDTTHSGYQPPLLSLFPPQSDVDVVPQQGESTPLMSPQQQHHWIPSS